MTKEVVAESGSKWWLTGILGLLMVGPAPMFIYHYIDAKEREGGTIRMNWIAVLAYDIFGKMGVTLLIALIGLGVVGAAVLEFRESRRAG